MAKLSFDPAIHIYTLAGRRVPSVTQVLADCGLGPPDWLDPVLLRGAADLGTIIHAATELIDEDDLDWSTVHPSIAAQLRAYERFRQTVEFALVASEERVVIADGRCAGTLDRRGMLGADPVIIDIKTGSDQRAYALQTAAYDLAFPDTWHRRFALFLKRDGTYRLKEYTDPDDGEVFLACLRLAEWRRSSRERV